MLYLQTTVLRGESLRRGQQRQNHVDLVLDVVKCEERTNENTDVTDKFSGPKYVSDK